MILLLICKRQYGILKWLMCSCVILNLQMLQKILNIFLSHFKGKFYVKDAWEKLAWCYYLQGNMTAANNARQMVLKKGSTDTDADKQANKDAKSARWPNTILLKARLLSDGGYNTQAMAMLEWKNSKRFSAD